MTDLSNITPGSDAWDDAMAAKGRAVREAYPDRAAEADFSRSARSGSEALMLQTLAASQPHHAMTEAHTQGSEGVFASATSRTGSPINGRRVLREDDRVTYQGMQITVASALGHGLLVKDAGGIIREAGQSAARPTEGAGNAAPEAAPNEPADEPQEAPFRGDDATEAAMTTLAAAPSAAMALDELTSKGELSERAVEQIALDLGISFEQATGHLTVAIEGLRASAAKACGMTDPKDQAAYDAWLLANPRRLQQARVAARMIGLNNDLTAIKELVKAWRQGKK